MNDYMKQYLRAKPTHWLESELEQAHAKATDESVSLDDRISALAAAAMLADELATRRRML